jgi:hypothetical protein
MPRSVLRGSSFRLRAEEKLACKGTGRSAFWEKRSNNDPQCGNKRSHNEEPCSEKGDNVE